MRLAHIALLLIVLLASLASCEGNDRRGGSSPPRVASEEIRLDFAALVESARFAFRREAPGFRAACGSYTSRSQGAVLSVTPSGRAESTLSLSLERVFLGRDGWRAAFGEEGIAEHDGSVSSSSDGVTERRRNTRAGVLQDWTFDRRPEGAGPLEVRLRVSGLPLAARTASGLHFLDPGSGLGLAYGHATWIDANGEKLAVLAELVLDEIVLRVPADAVDGARYPAVLDPLISPEFGVDNPVSTADDSPSMSVARAGNTYLVSWMSPQGWVYAARVDATSGQLLDPFGIEIALASDAFGAVLGAARPSVASNGTDFLIAYPWTVSGFFSDVLAKRVRASDGLVLDAKDIPISTTSALEGRPALLFTGSQYFVVWSEGGSAGVIRGARLDAVTGQRVDGSPTTSPTAIMTGLSGTGKAVATNGANVLVAADGKGARFDATTGAVLDSTPFKITGLASGPAVSWGMDDASAAFDGTNYFVAWRTWGGGGITGARVTPAGVVLDPPDEFNQLPGGLPVCSATGVTQALVLASGTSRLLLTVQSKALYASRLDTTTGALADKQTGTCGKWIAAVTGAGNPIVGATLSPGSLLALNYSVAMQVDPTTLAVQKSTVVAKSANDELEPRVASNGADFLVVWADNRNRQPGLDDSDVFAARIKGQDGSLLDPTGFAVSTGAGKQLAPAVASDGKDYFVVWESGTSGIRGTRVRASDGAVLDGTPASDGKQVHYSSGNVARTEPAIASDGVGYLVAYLEQVSGGGKALSAVRYAADGTLQSNVSGYQISIGSASNDRSGPAVSADRVANASQRTYLIAWQELSAGKWKLRHARVRAALGSSIDPSGKDVADVDDKARVQAASDGANFLLAWAQNAGGAPAQRNVFGMRVEPANGTLLDPAPIAIATSSLDDFTPSAAFDGKHYYTLWSAQAAGVSAVVGMRLGSDGKLLDGPASNGGFQVSDALTSSVRAAASAAGRVLVVYPRSISAQGSTASRVRARFVQDSPEELDAGISWDGPWWVPDAADASTDGAPADAPAEVAAETSIDAGPDGAGGGAGSAGAPAGGGAAGSGSSGGSAGGAGSGPSAGGGAAGTSAGGHAGQTAAASGDDSGCGCRVPAHGGARASTVLGLLFALGALSRRRGRPPLPRARAGASRAR